MLSPHEMNREWLETDGWGGFASGTASGIRTRRYHALLLAAGTPPAGRMVLVNGFDAEVETAAGRLAISSQRYTSEQTSPDGVTRLESFSLDPWPTWTYAVYGGKIVQEVFVPRGRVAVVLRWRGEGLAAAGLRLHVRPLFSGRDFHGNHHENVVFGFLPASGPEGECWSLYPGVPRVLASSNGAYHHEPCWYRNFLYAEEVDRGLDPVEDLAAPGRYEFDLTASDAVLILSAPDLDVFAPTSPGLSRREQARQLAGKERTRRATFATPHLRAADAYLVRRGEGGTIIAGYPWFGDWGRDTFIALRGLCLATGRLAEAEQILTAWAGTVSQGMLPNCFPDQGGPPEYNSVDASLWYIIAVHEFLARADETTRTRSLPLLLEAVEAILTGYAQGTRYRIGADIDGLLSCGEPGVQLTWMDAKVGGWVVTPRIGKPVEIQALWLNALALTAPHQPRWQTLFELGSASFLKRFWNEEAGCLYDVIDVDHQAGQNDASFRPNQIFAIGGLPLSLLEGDRARRMVDSVERTLWTPLGLRSLAPGAPSYAPRYEGDQLHRDGSYHQGTVWPWLAGPFVEAWVRVHGSTPEIKVQARKLFLQPQLCRLDLAGLHHIPEIADGDAPHLERGCPFQAWSLSELLRLELQVLAPGSSEKQIAKKEA